MAFNHTLSAILRGSWLIDKQWAFQHLPMVMQLLKGQNINAQNVTSKQVFKTKSAVIPGDGYQDIAYPEIVDPATMQTYSSYVWVSGIGYVPNPNIPKGSIAVFQVNGPITKYNGDCGEPGSIRFSQWINEMNYRENIAAMIFVTDTPGGESRAAYSFVSAIQDTRKPTISYVQGMAASLGVWLTSSCDEVFFSDEMDELGSVGSYATILDYRGWFEKEGIKIHEIYAPQSTDKNKDYRDAIEGNYAAVEADLKLHVDRFISFVNNQRGAKAAASEKEWRSGKMFYAKDAIKLGLADGISSFEKVISKASWLAKRNK